MQIDPIKRWNELKDRKATLEDELDEVKAQLAELDSQIQESFIEEGVQNIKVDGHTVFLYRQIWAKKADPEMSTQEICDALGAAGLGDFVKEGYNTQTLSAWLREQEQPDGSFDLPLELQGIIEAAPKFEIRRRKS